MCAQPLMDEEIDRKQLRVVVARFRAHHAERLKRARAILSAEQRLVLDTLPLLVHTNHPSLPGFVTGDTPAGIHGYSPDTTTLVAAKQVAPSYRHDRLTDKHDDIHALYVMGSSGTLGHAAGSDLDLWICCPRVLHDGLVAKVQRLNQWAATHDLKLHSFLVDPSDFLRGGKIHGSDTPRLLLDEFYRSGALVAGRYPIWWLVPEDAPYDTYCERLRAARYVKAADTVDFGPVDAIPASEIPAASIRELSRAIRTPYKSLMKLVLIQSYSDDPTPLSLAYKTAIHKGVDGYDALDPYLMMYRRTQTYLESRREHDRVRFMQRCLVSKVRQGRGIAWQKPTLAALRREFDLAEELSATRAHSLAQALKESNLINDELTQSHLLLRQLADRHPLSERGTDLLARIDRELAVLTDEKAHKLPRLNQAVISDALGDELTVTHAEGRWHVTERGTRLYSNDRLVACAAWCWLSGAKQANFGQDMPTGAHTIMQGLEDARFVVFVNAEQNPMENVGGEGDTLITERRDPLNFSGFHHNLVRTLDVVYRNAESEWFANSYTGEAGLAKWLVDVARLTFAPDAVYCLSGPNKDLVEERLTTLFARLRATDDVRYLIAIGGTCVAIRPRRRNFQVLATEEALLSYLARPSDAALLVDADSEVLTPIRLIAEQAQSGSAVAIDHTRGRTDIWFADTDGSLHNHSVDPRSDTELVGELFVFFANLSRRGFPIPRLFTVAGGKLVSATPTEPKLPTPVVVRVEGERVHLRIGAERFPDQRRDGVAEVIARAMLEHRESDEIYPIYLSDVQLHESATLAEHLAVKQQLESELSSVIYSAAFSQPDS